MRDDIVLVSVKLLNNLGVKFTIDDIKNELKISKKTIYKYFASKEELAQAVFDHIIDKAKNRQIDIRTSSKSPIETLILCLLEYMEIFRLQSEKISNLYSINQKLLVGAKQNSETNWALILDIYHLFINQGCVRKIDDDIFKIMIEGIFKNIYSMEDRDKVGYKCLKAIVEK